MTKLEEDVSDKEDNIDKADDIHNQSRWVQLALNRDDVQASELANSKKGSELRFHE